MWRKAILWIVGIFVVLLVAWLGARQCAVREHPDLDWLEGRIDLSEAQLDLADAYAVGCRTDIALWVEKAAVEDELRTVRGMIVMVPDAGLTGEYGRWLADQVMDVSDRAAIVSEQISYACDDQSAGTRGNAPVEPELVATAVSVPAETGSDETEPDELPSVILVKDVIFGCDWLFEQFEDMTPEEVSDPWERMAYLMTRYWDLSGRYADFNRDEAKAAYMECRG